MNRPLLRHAVSPVLLALLAAGVIVTGQASALSMGALSTSSRLGEPLHARLVLDGVPADHQGVSVTVTGRDTVRNQTIAWNSRIDTDAVGRTFLLISSAERIEDPALSLHIVVRTADGAETSKDQTLLLSPDVPARAVASSTMAAGKVIPMTTAPVTDVPTVVRAAAPIVAAASSETAIQPIVPVGATSDPVPDATTNDQPVKPHPRKKIVHPSVPAPVQAMADPVPPPAAGTPVVAATAGNDDAVRELNVQLLNVMVRQAELQADELRLIQKIQEANASAAAVLARQARMHPALAPTPVPVQAMASVPAVPASTTPVIVPAPALPLASTAGSAPAAKAGPTVAAAVPSAASGAPTTVLPTAVPAVTPVPVTVLPTAATEASSNALGDGPSVPAPASSASSVARDAGEPASAAPAGAVATSDAGAVVTGGPASTVVPASAPRAASRPHPVRRMTPGVVHDEASTDTGLLGLGVSPLAASGAGVLVVLLGLLMVRRRRNKPRQDSEGHLDNYVGPDVEHASGQPGAAPVEPSMEVIDFGNPPDLRIPPDPSEPGENTGSHHSR